MRIDKFLWCIRFYKTRNIATEACKKGHIFINGNPAKPSREVLVSDRIQVRKNQISYQLSVIAIPPSRVGAKLVALYCQDLTPSETYEHLELLKKTQNYYREKGEGRPTKKDRRALDDWFDSDNSSWQWDNDE